MAADPESVKRRIGFIPDRPFIYEKLTGMEFMRFSADLYGVDERVFSENAEALLKKFAILNWADELIESYSHGMKQRLIISSALLHNPTVIIVDEPMVGLDPAAIKMVKNMFRELAHEGMTIFMSTHTLTVAEDICDRIGVIHKGSLIATGTAGDLRRIAGVEAADLEEVFLNLTGGQEI
jgi:ABC-2 type transport system ATP-binding protein